MWTYSFEYLSLENNNYTRSILLLSRVLLYTVRNNISHTITTLHKQYIVLVDCIIITLSFPSSSAFKFCHANWMLYLDRLFYLLFTVVLNGNLYHTWRVGRQGRKPLFNWYVCNAIYLIHFWLIFFILVRF